MDFSGCLAQMHRSCLERTHANCIVWPIRWHCGHLLCLLWRLVGHFVRRSHSIRPKNEWSNRFGGRLRFFVSPVFNKRVRFRLDKSRESRCSGQAELHLKIQNIGKYIGPACGYFTTRFDDIRQENSAFSIFQTQQFGTLQSQLTQTTLIASTKTIKSINFVGYFISKRLPRPSKWHARVDNVVGKLILILELCISTARVYAVLICYINRLCFSNTFATKTNARAHTKWQIRDDSIVQMIRLTGDQDFRNDFGSLFWFRNVWTEIANCIAEMSSTRRRQMAVFQQNNTFSKHCGSHFCRQTQYLDASAF